MPRWEYARLYYSVVVGTPPVATTTVHFTHQEAWEATADEPPFETMRRLGDEGWELVTYSEDIGTGEEVVQWWFKRYRPE